MQNKTLNIVTMLSSLIVIGCTSSTSTSTSSTDATQEKLILDMIDDCLSLQKYESEDYTKINADAYTSELNSDNSIDVYVSNFAADVFRRVDPNSTGSGVELPINSVIVRKVWDQNHYFNAYTVMVKAPQGYYPDGGDFFYGVLNSDGTFQKDENGKFLQGKITECGDCHRSTRSDDGFLFGVPTAVQSSKFSSIQIAAAIQPKIEQLALFENAEGWNFIGELNDREYWSNKDQSILKQQLTTTGEIDLTDEKLPNGTTVIAIDNNIANVTPENAVWLQVKQSDENSNTLFSGYFYKDGTSVNGIQEETFK
ncbi:MAG: hypothetical protein AAGB12_01315 [Pseudomonadota bacterium]